MATFETDLRTADDIETMLAGQTGALPDGGGGARWPGRGLARAALTEVARLGADRGLLKLVSRIFPENQANRALCQCLGFREVGVYAWHAKLDGAWKRLRHRGEADRGSDLRTLRMSALRIRDPKAASRSPRRVPLTPRPWRRTVTSIRLPPGLAVTW